MNAEGLVRLVDYNSGHTQRITAVPDKLTVLVHSHSRNMFQVENLNVTFPATHFIRFSFVAKGLSLHSIYI